MRYGIDIGTVIYYSYIVGGVVQFFNRIKAPNGVLGIVVLENNDKNARGLHMNWSSIGWIGWIVTGLIGWGWFYYSECVSIAEKRGIGGKEIQQISLPPSQRFAGALICSIIGPIGLVIMLIVSRLTSGTQLKWGLKF